MADSSKEEGKKPLTTEERLRQRKKKDASKENRGEKREESNLTGLQRLRSVVDALVFAFVLAMFIRSFIFELYKIPTGSMTPTLIGDDAGQVVSLDYDEDGVKDYVYTWGSQARPNDVLQIYLMNEDGTYKDQIFVENVSRDLVLQLKRNSPHRTDMIIVNKFAYWFRQPTRGDIAVFKVPHRPDRGIKWEPAKPVYIKRVVGLPGEEVTIMPVDLNYVGMQDARRYGTRFGGVELHLDTKPVRVDGSPIPDERFDTLMHYPNRGPNRRSIYPLPSHDPDQVALPSDSVLMIGDNAASSLDGRYWGGVPMNQLRGKALFRYMPLSQLGFLN